MSFRLKLIFGGVAIQAVLLVVMIVSGLNALKSSNEEALMKRAETTAKLFASTTQSAVLATDLAALESLVNEVLSNPGIVYARVRSRLGVLAEGGDNKHILARPFAADTSLASAEQDAVYDAHADIIVAGEKYGQVEIGLSTALIQQLISETRNQSLTLAGASLALVGLFSLMLGMYLTRGLNALQQATRQIAEGGFGHQIQVRGKDELAATALAFNEMSAKLKDLDEERVRKEEEIRQLNLELERRVIERTMQLQDANQQLEHQALHDTLTQLPNRVLFHDRLRSALLNTRRTNEPFALIGLDLDLFKEINDTLGHHAGDMVLHHVAEACAVALRDTDTAARMGGDEFAILLPKVTDAQCAFKAAQRVLAAIKQPLQIGNHTVEVGASLGVVIYPEHGADEAELISHADAAMYEAKRQKLGVVLYRPELGDGKSEAVVLKGELRRAIQEDQLVLHFQPKVDLVSHQINGAEALVRWKHPRLGLLYPDKFIMLAETSGLIKPLTQEVLRLALKQIHSWRQRGYEFPVSVNVSAVNLQDKDFPETVTSMLAEYNVPSPLVELEVTETAIMTEPKRAIENIRKLSTRGIQVSIDDFGTGYSSMAYLQKLLVAKIKIDKSFVMEMGNGVNDETIVRSTIDLAHNLGLKAVAEGVESQAVWDKLRELGCDSAQGYFMSKPLPPDKFVEWVQGSPWGMRDATAIEKDVLNG